ncbi:MAG TPA: o-succinylbenzoate synthase [Ilumatobacteraceae bacterium]|nr:o-succinylbenzoate synthase [Ilumatobacteraceae bacterium]
MESPLLTPELFELRRLRMPLVRPFRTSFGTETVREVMIVRVVTDVGEGWGECSIESKPLYLSEFLDAADHVFRDHLAPRLFAAGPLRACQVADALEEVKGHRMAKSAMEMAILDAELRAEGRSFHEFLGGTRSSVPVGVSVGITDTVDELVDIVAGYVAEGYRRIKLKIEPGFDIEPVRRVREANPDVMLQVDANTAYFPRDIDHLGQLDPFDLLLIEQPFGEDDLVGHAELAKQIATPVCLDEAIRSLDHARSALALDAAAIINIKPARVGGYLAAVAIHDHCVEAGVPVWCGGMLETGIGRSANLALASLPGFTLPGDISATKRYWTKDITQPFELEEGEIAVPVGIGFGVEVDTAFVEELTVRRDELRP